VSGKSDLSVVIISPNAPYRSVLVDMLRKQHGIVVEADGACAEQILKEAPGLQPSIAFVDGRAIDSVRCLRKAWPNALILCLLDYLSDWESATGSGADVCVLKEQGASTIIGSITYIIARIRCQAGQAPMNAA